LWVEDDDQVPTEIRFQGNIFEHAIHKAGNIGKVWSWFPDLCASCVKWRFA
jgi:hypothetical protein